MKQLRHAVDLVGAEAVDAPPVARGRGIRTPQFLAAIARRDEALRAIAQHFPGLSQREAARKVRDVVSMYANGSWRRERTAVTCPTRHLGRVTAHCFEALKARDAVPSLGTTRAALSRYSLATDAGTL
ncbi:hypothetical protein [Bradyrhizobium sp. LMTR 3]|uniref:hypothetical protein n=1 Tax=Bradyrhizobium sp. LMTR 3 TaxID=189873 RepID=UPI001147248B|nr:hypothetical protein [Bradyrhizobium sp. LMTR 3]